MPSKTSCLLDSQESPKPTILFSYTVIPNNCCRIQLPGTVQPSGLSLRTASPGYPPTIMNMISTYFCRKMEEKLKANKIPSCLIPHLLVSFTWQREILMIALSLLPISLNQMLLISSLKYYFATIFNPRNFSLSNNRPCSAYFLYI